MTKQITLEEFEERRNRVDSADRRLRMKTLRCGCSFEECNGWSVEDPDDLPSSFIPSWKAWPDFIGPLEQDPEMEDWL